MHTAHILKRQILPLLFSCLCWQCGETVQNKTPLREETKTRPVRETIPEELLALAGIATSDTTAETRFDYTLLDPENAVLPSDLATNLRLYKTIRERGTSDSLPLFELRAPRKSILISGDTGYIGSIWVLMLINKDSMQLEDIQFGHKAESEGYGDLMTHNSFESQFRGYPLQKELPLFSLMQAGREQLPGAIRIDGISGATGSSGAAVALVNDGVHRYLSSLEK